MADFTIYRGDTVDLNIVVTASGSVFSLVGCSMWFTAKLALSAADPGVFQKTVGNGITFTNAAQGRATVRISPTDTSTLGNSKVLLLYDCQIKTSSGSVYTIAYGNLIVIPDITLST